MRNGESRLVRWWWAFAWGSLGNTPGPGNEVLMLLDDAATTMDTVNYDDTAPWPEGSVNGPSIHLKSLALDNTAGGNWARSEVGVAGGVSPSGPTFITTDVGSPGSVPASWTCPATTTTMAS